MSLEKMWGEKGVGDEWLGGVEHYDIDLGICVTASAAVADPRHRSD